jgi:AcrR family transcriptional regulator
VCHHSPSVAAWDTATIWIIAVSRPPRNRPRNGGAGPPRLRRDESQAQTREALIEAASRLFDARGFAATSIADIAGAAGYTTGALYSNFAGKEDLFLDVLERQLTDEISALGAALSAEPTVGGRLRVVGRWYASQAGRGRRRTRAVAELALLARNSEQVTARLRDQRRLMRDALAALLRQQQDELDIAFALPIASLATAVLAMLEGFALASAIEGEIDPAALVAGLELLLRPASPPRGGRT